jgi:hypothetical protein
MGRILSLVLPCRSLRRTVPGILPLILLLTLAVSLSVPSIMWAGSMCYPRFEVTVYVRASLHWTVEPRHTSCSRSLLLSLPLGMRRMMLMAMICTTPQALTVIFSLEGISSIRPEDRLDLNSQALIDGVT